MYDGWNLLEELNGLSSNAALFKYTWGLDLSGQNGGGADQSRDREGAVSGLHSAGGIGGLLAMLDTKGTPSNPNDDRQLAYFYDANGNVGQLIDCDPASAYFGQIQARYEYYPFGGILVSTGTYAEINPFKFSTKYRDGETGLYYYGYRYLISRLGRWVNRDPIEELGGVNLYEAMGDDPVDKIDPHGRDYGTGAVGREPPPSPGCPKKKGDDCWQTCLQNQALGDGGFVICRADGCRCACLNETSFPPVDPTADPGRHALRMCVLAHEEYHVMSPRVTCDCSPKPCKIYPKKWRYRKDEECFACAIEINCLCNSKISCNGNAACLNMINARIAQEARYCSGLGGDVYMHGANRCP